MKTAPVELRNRGRTLFATILQEGRAASGGLREVFAPGSVQWSSSGIPIRTEHGGEEVARALPDRRSDGRIEVRARATRAIREAVASGKTRASVEFRALEDRVTRGGVREILEALLTGAALTAAPEYDSTSAEVRTRRRRRFVL